ncbi:MAG TPA: PP2C family protein-serine/threonine phosphatase [Acidimicrobiales bacterium]
MPADRAEHQAPDPLAWLLDVSHTLPPVQLATAVDEAFRRAGARRSCMFLVDHDQMALHPLGSHDDGLSSFPVEGTVGGRAFTFESTVEVPAGEGGGVRMWLPMLNGTARLGVVSVDLDDAAAADGTILERITALASELVMSKAQYTDAIELARRHRAMSLEAELQRGTLPPVALITPTVSIAGLLLPAYEVAGDAFDYALNEHDVHVAVIDSVGHELVSSLISHLVSGSLRNSRRCGVDLAEAYAAADAAVATAFPDVRFATAAFGRLDLGSGRFRWVSAGHPPPVVVRDGRVTGEAPTRPVLPIGLGGGEPPVNEVVLDPGDMLLLYTDGAVEGGVRGSERFGLDRLLDLLGQNLLDGVPPAELLRRLVRAVLEHSAYELHDDTTLLLVHYRGVGGA